MTEEKQTESITNTWEAERTIRECTPDYGRFIALFRRRRNALVARYGGARARKAAERLLLVYKLGYLAFPQKAVVLSRFFEQDRETLTKVLGDQPGGGSGRSLSGEDWGMTETEWQEAQDDVLRHIATTQVRRYRACTIPRGSGLSYSQFGRLSIAALREASRSLLSR